MSPRPKVLYRFADSCKHYHSFFDPPTSKSTAWRRHVGRTVYISRFAMAATMLVSCWYLRRLLRRPIFAETSAARRKGRMSSGGLGDGCSLHTSISQYTEVTTRRAYRVWLLQWCCYPILLACCPGLIGEEPSRGAVRPLLGSQSPLSLPGWCDFDG